MRTTPALRRIGSIKAPSQPEPPHPARNSDLVLVFRARPSCLTQLSYVNEIVDPPLILLLSKTDHSHLPLTETSSKSPNSRSEASRARSRRSNSARYPAARTRRRPVLGRVCGWHRDMSKAKIEKYPRWDTQNRPRPGLRSGSARLAVVAADRSAAGARSGRPNRYDQRVESTNEEVRPMPGAGRRLRLVVLAMRGAIVLGMRRRGRALPPRRPRARRNRSGVGDRKRNPTDRATRGHASAGREVWIAGAAFGTSATTGGAEPTRRRQQ